MTSFICMLDENNLFLATDTLATTPAGKPFLFTSKATHVPHLKSLIMGTGAGGFANRWANHVSASMVLSGINNLDYHTPQALRELWGTFREEHSVPSEVTTTVYHFGMSEEDGQMCGFAYRSTEDFSSEPLDYGWRYKPECSTPEGGDIEAIVEAMMLEQREIQETLPINERVFIGGEAILHHLMPGSYAVYNLFKFDDYNETMNEIFNNYQG